MQDVLQRGSNGRVVEEEDAGQDVEQTATGFGMAGGFDDDGGHERTQEDAPGVGAEFERLAAEVHESWLRSAWKAALALSRAFISARASQKERVDSAPWFWLARLGWSPSRQPPDAAS